jgi:hypothetical protein
MWDICFCILLAIGGAFVKEMISGGGIMIRGITKDYDKKLDQIDKDVSNQLKGLQHSKKEIREWDKKYHVTDKYLRH